MMKNPAGFRALWPPLAAVSAAALCACAGLRMGGGGVSGEGAVLAGPDLGASRAAAAEEARRAVVASCFDLFLSTPLPAPVEATLSEKVLAHATAYLESEGSVSVASEGGRVVARLRASIRYAQLAKDLDSLGLIKPEGVQGRPRIAVALAPPTAAEAARRSLDERGYATAPSSVPAAVVVSGEGSVEPEALRVAGLRAAKARLSVEARAPSGEAFLSFVQEASAVDVSSAGAATRALENAGEAVAERLRRELGARFVERRELGVVIDGIGEPERARPLLAALRRAPKVAAAALDSVANGDVRIRVFAERTGADDLAAELLRLPGWSFSVRSVDPDGGVVELDSGGSPF